MKKIKLASWLTLIVVCLACNNKDSFMYQEPASPTIAAKYTYLALGDSYTIGESVATENRWTYYLVAYLRQSGIAINYPVTIARTGWTTAELQEGIRANNITTTYDLVTLLIGVNNQYRGQSLETYRTEFRELISTSVKFAANQPTHVLVLSIPDWGVTPFAEGRDRAKITQEIIAFNLVAKEECQQAGVGFVDITPASYKAIQDESYVATDKLHFSGKMYNEWAALALPAARAVFGK
ncbi:lysophospholipase [Adhaeribacter arboris]|uniref:Lysophospholipase n=1 Tax=Adhaeribacter arboris TaxID=2072846 RepID=A0A2T2YPE1_9BACT|nr:SGNH/GDSL hydrolase family protein [Adhaeribacter arboris]PSR57387.1 lysophospholipase [Adhaeribacter arboris]